MHKESANKICIPFSGNEALSGILAACGTGDTVELSKVTFTVDEATQEMITGTIDKIDDAKVIDSPGPEASDEEREKARKAPVMSVMGSDAGLDRDNGAQSRDAFVS